MPRYKPMVELKKRRKSLGLNQTQLAERAGVSQNTRGCRKILFSPVPVFPHIPVCALCSVKRRHSLRQTALMLMAQST